jgi:hypothetical protein
LCVGVVLEKRNRWACSNRLLFNSIILSGWLEPLWVDGGVGGWAMIGGWCHYSIKYQTSCMLRTIERRKSCRPMLFFKLSTADCLLLLCAKAPPCHLVVFG